MQGMSDRVKDRSGLTGSAARCRAEERVSPPTALSYA